MKHKFCWECKEKLEGAGYILTEIPETGTERGKCPFCGRIGFFPVYEARKEKKHEVD